MVLIPRTGRRRSIAHRISDRFKTQQEPIDDPKAAMLNVTLAFASDAYDVIVGLRKARQLNVVGPFKGTRK
jgi:hypothetical protein